ncbi:Tar ligand binding domain-containing protein [Paraburkholderia kirstenboschensis]|uniref:Tar ligand binding domain-containing protein n=1 Tax=Paraburkholderia kirstenboschensis TaxID=1245436 RepID=A0ABZ0EBY4_9BURK|nr:Tar ligand binding domain-containing protein [Paraburkholderia kirstenboschensis]WOD14741.1 Tar ligand binding domain-containing protein [Paraburkholderia kirstenboschensis]
MVSFESSLGISIVTLSRRLLLTLSVALLALIFFGALGLWRLNQAQQRFEYVQVNVIPSIMELGDAKSELGNYARLNYQYLLSTDDAGRASGERAINALNRRGHGAQCVRENVKFSIVTRDDVARQSPSEADACREGSGRQSLGARLGWQWCFYGEVYWRQYAETLVAPKHRKESWRLSGESSHP